MNIYKKDFPKSVSVVPQKRERKFPKSVSVPQKRERKIVISYKSSSFQKHYFSLALAKEYSKLIAAKEITKSIKKNSKN
jgi:hypothetical protein